METTILNPQVVYVQATTPSDLTQGKLWYNTTDNTLYTSNGTSYVGMETDLSDLQRQQLEQNLNILINSVASSSTLNDWDDMFVDSFSDADGTSDTIDTANTTAVFNTNLYENKAVDTEEQLNEVTGSERTFITKKTFNLSPSILLDGAVSNEIAITSGLYLTECRLKYTYADDSEDYSETESVTGTSNLYVAKTYSNPDGTGLKEIKKIEVQLTCNEYSYLEKNTIVPFSLSAPIKLIVQTNAITCDTAQISHQVFSHNAVAGTGNITYDISFDNGSTYDTAQALNTKNARSSTTGTEMILKLNLIGNKQNTATADDYGIMLFY